MDIDLLKEIVGREGFTMKKILEKINLTEPGFYQGIKAGSLKVRHLEAMADVMNISVCEFFGGKGSVVNPNDAAYKEKYWKTLEKYNAMLEENAELRREVLQLRNAKK